MKSTVTGVRYHPHIFKKGGTVNNKVRKIQSDIRSCKKSGYRRKMKKYSAKLSRRLAKEAE